MFSTLAAIAATFLVLPVVYVQTAPWVRMHILGAYQPSNMENAMLAWKVLLALLIFASVRSVLNLAFSAASLALAMRVIRLARGR